MGDSACSPLMLGHDLPDDHAGWILRCCHEFLERILGKGVQHCL